jgi:hypothetical protein
MSRIKIYRDGMEDLKKIIEESNGNELQVGWFDSAKYDDNTPVAGVAALQEFGGKSIPPRPFFRPTIADKENDWANLVDSGFTAIVNEQSTMSDVLNGLGLTVQAHLKNAISQGDHLPLSPVTLAIRRLRDEGVKIGGSVVGAVASAVADGETGAGELGEPSANKDPLRDTGIMLATLTYEVTQ